MCATPFSELLLIFIAHRTSRSNHVSCIFMHLPSSCIMSHPLRDEQLRARNGDWTNGLPRVPSRHRLVNFKSYVFHVFEFKADVGSFVTWSIWVSKLKNWPRSMIQIRLQYKLHKSEASCCEDAQQIRCNGKSEVSAWSFKDLTSFMLCASGKQWWKSRAHNITTSCEVEMPRSAKVPYSKWHHSQECPLSIALPSFKIAKNRSPNVSKFHYLPSGPNTKRLQILQDSFEWQDSQPLQLAVSVAESLVSSRFHCWKPPQPGANGGEGWGLTVK